MYTVTKDEVPQDVLNTWQEGQSLEGPGAPALTHLETT